MSIEICLHLRGNCSCWQAESRQRESWQDGRHVPKYRNLFKSNLAICMKRQMYNSCVHPAMKYGAEPWTLAKHAHNKLALHILKMERRMLNTTYTPVQVYTYRRTSIWAEDRTQFTYIISNVTTMKWSWVGHISHPTYDRWTSRVTTWRT